MSEVDLMRGTSLFSVELEVGQSELARDKAKHGDQRSPNCWAYRR
jgi:hypothetical protein